MLFRSKRRQLVREVAGEKRRKRGDREIMQEEHRYESSEVEENITAIGLMQQGAGSVSGESGESKDELEDVLVSEGKELEEVDESVFFSTQCYTTSSILSSATGVEQNGLRGKFVGMTLEH